LLGKHGGQDVYKVDVSMIVSKYIGETEKNLERFLIWPNTRNGFSFSMKPMRCSANEPESMTPMIDTRIKKSASYSKEWKSLAGSSFLTNLKGNIDDAFIRRFQSIVYFPMPKAVQELLGHSDVKTTMIDTHVLNRGVRGVRSPADASPGGNPSQP